MSTDEAWLLAAGCDDYLAKPYRRTQLLQVTKRVLAAGAHRTAREAASHR